MDQKCKVCGDELRPVGYWNYGGKARVVFRCGCLIDVLSCVTRQEYHRETGRLIKHLWRGNRRRGKAPGLLSVE